MTAEVAAFIGYFTMAGPNGYVEGPTPEAVREFADVLLAKYGHALSGQVRKVWFEPLWRVKVWSRVELSGN